MIIIFVTYGKSIVDVGGRQTQSNVSTNPRPHGNEQQHVKKNIVREEANKYHIVRSIDDAENRPCR